MEIHDNYSPSGVYFMSYLTTLNDIFDVMDTAFTPSNTVKQSVCSSNFPFSDIYIDEKESYVIEIGLAGYTEKEVSVEYRDSYLTVTGKAPEVNKENRRYIRAGLKFPSEFTVRYGVDISKFDVSKSDVTMVNGILKIVIPTKKDFIKSKTFAINAK